MKPLWPQTLWVYRYWLKTLYAFNVFRMEISSWHIYIYISVGLNSLFSPAIRLHSLPRNAKYMNDNKWEFELVPEVFFTFTINASVVSYHPLPPYILRRCKHQTHHRWTDSTILSSSAYSFPPFSWVYNQVQHPKISWSDDLDLPGRSDIGMPVMLVGPGDADGYMNNALYRWGADTYSCTSDRCL